MKQRPLPPPPVPPVMSAKQVAAPRPVAQPPMPPQPSPMARPPVAPTKRLVPSAKTPRGTVRTDTHNQANQVPSHAKHTGRGKP